MSESPAPKADPRSPASNGGGEAVGRQPHAWTDYVAPPSTLVPPSEYAFLGTDLVDLLAQMRVAIGLALILAPGAITRLWVGAGGATPGAKVLARALGGRDLVLGVGAILALRDEIPVRRWVLLGAASDAVDGVATLLALRHIPKLRGLLAVVAAAGAALAGAGLAGRVD